MPPTESGAIGVGMPAVLHLNAFAREITDAFGETPYLVGSAARGKTWRDVDIRLILPDDHFDRLFPEHSDSSGELWSLLCAAIAELGRQRTGLPIDFQIQRCTAANALYPGIRHALGIAHHPRGYDTTPAPAGDTTAAGSLARAIQGIATFKKAGVSAASFGLRTPDGDDEPTDIDGALATSPPDPDDSTGDLGGEEHR